MDPSLQSDLNTALALVRDHNWIAIAAVIDGLLIRLAKSDRAVSFFPVAIAPSWRPWCALLVGIVEGIIAIKLLSHGTWSEAIGGGISAGITAITGHELVVESLRGGRDMFVPKAPAPPDAPPPPKPISIKPPTNVTITMLLLVVLLVACKPPDPVVLVINSGDCLEKALATKLDGGTCEEKKARMLAVLRGDRECVDLYGDASIELVCRVKDGGADVDR
jgi:hypothetical protein